MSAFLLASREVIPRVPRLRAADEDVVDGNVYWIEVSMRETEQLWACHGYGEHVLSLTRYPTAPMMRKPTPTAWHSRRNSFWSAANDLVSTRTTRRDDMAPASKGRED